MVVGEGESLATVAQWDRFGRVFAAMFLVGIVAPQSTASEACGDITVRVDIKGELVRVNVEAVVVGTTSEVWAVLTDFEHLPQFISNITSSKVLSRDSNVVRVSQSGKTSFGPLTFEFQSVREITLTPFVKFESRMISGNMKQFYGVTQIETADSATRIRYRSEAIPDTALPLSLGRSLIESETHEHFNEICKEVLRRKSVAAGR